MANYAYLSVWLKDFNIQKGLTHLETALSLFPVSTQRPGFCLVVRSLDQTQSPSLEAELLATPPEVRLAANEYLHEDTVYEVTAHWTLWLPRGEEDWEEAPSPVEILLHGEQFDAGRFREAGHLQIRLGGEQLYTVPPGRSPQDYLRYARENAHRLFVFLHAAEKSLPVAEWKLWSEGQPAFAQRVEGTSTGRVPTPPTEQRG